MAPQAISVPQIVSRLNVSPPTVVVTWSPTGIGGTATKWPLGICISFAAARDGKAVAWCPRPRDLALPAPFGPASLAAVRRGQTGQLEPLIAPQGAQRVGHQQDLEGDEPADHPETHRTDEVKQRKSDARESPG